MRCIICLIEQPPSEEHIFPESIGGSLVTQRVCKPCNDLLGANADAPLVNSLPVRMARNLHKIKGGSEKLPEVFGEGVLDDETEQRVRVTTDPNTGAIDVRLHPKITSGTKGDEIRIDARDIHRLPTIVARLRKRRGLPELTDEQLQDEIARLMSVAERGQITGVPVKHSKLVDTREFARGLAKIAYQLGHRYLGEAYLEDPVAANLRNYVTGKGDHSSTRGKVLFGSGADEFPFRMWADDKTRHIAFITKAESGVAAGIRIFDVYNAVFPLSDSATRYPATTASEPHGYFISIDPVTGSSTESTFAEEVARFCAPEGNR